MTQLIRNKARKLRLDMTDAERKLWRSLRSRQLRGYKFRRQEPVGNYVVDFVCKQHRLVIEVDGGQHAEQEKSDKARTRWLNEQGYRVLRFWNNQVLGELPGVLARIEEALAASSPHPNPLPFGERGSDSSSPSS